jgi:hypothetical protein
MNQDSAVQPTNLFSAGWNAATAKASDTEIAKQFVTLTLRRDKLAGVSTAPMLNIHLEAVMLRLRRGSVSPCASALNQVRNPG